MANKFDGDLMEILAWEKYNGRKDVDKPSWFRLQNDLAFDDGFYDFSAEELWLWVFLLSLASRKNKGSFLVNIDYIADHARLTTKTVIGAIEKLVRDQRVHLTPKAAYADVTPTLRGRDATEITEKTEITENCDLNFESVYAEYKKLPGVVKGSKAEARFREQITNPELLTCLIAAIQNYRKFLSLPENSWRKPKTSFETFLGSKSGGFFWKDFIALESVGTAKETKQLTLEDLKAMKL